MEAPGWGVWVLIGRLVAGYDDRDAGRHNGCVPWVLLLLFASGWAANHFTALLPVLARSEGVSRHALEGAYGIYAVGLVPGLLGGGALSDRWGRRPILLTGATVAGLGNLALLCWHDHLGIFFGRLLVGAGVGMAMSSGTAWTADLGGASGTTLAGLFLTAGFGCGPLFSGLTAQFTGSVALPFVTTLALSAVAVTLGAIGTARIGPSLRASTVQSPADDSRTVRTALRVAVPMALWVFACASVAMVTMAERMAYRYEGPWLPGVVAAVTLTAGFAAQTLARLRGWGPTAGVFGAAAAAVGFAAIAAAGATPSLASFFGIAVILGTAYGLCLREGLIDIETLAPARLRGILTGVFYVVTYLGFGLPVVLSTVEPSMGIVAPVLVLSATAAVAALVRTRFVKSGVHILESDGEA